MTTAAVCAGYQIKCSCGAVTVAGRAESHRAWEAAGGRYYAKLQCRECGRWGCARGIAGRIGKRKCGAWCTEGTGLTCTCECGGSNHGSAYPPGTLDAALKHETNRRTT